MGQQTAEHEIVARRSRKRLPGRAPRVRWQAVSGMVSVLFLTAFLPLQLARAGQVEPLPTMPPPTVADRLLVIAPHCDDETLGPGGLVTRTLAVGGTVRVVVVTNGDGFHYGAEKLFREREVAPIDYVRMGMDRQAETLAAMAELGVKADAVSFLGYPDHGTAAMWLEHWDPTRPYTSPQTLEDHSPYLNAFTKDAPYAGRAVVADLKRIITEFRPTVVAYPHPNDEHPDHWAAYCYTVASLYELGQLDRVRQEHYLVHRGAWPLPRGLHPRLPLLPPQELMLLGMQWRELPLSPMTVQRKSLAISRYRSQMLVMRGFLLSFARANEVFGAMPPRSLPSVAPGTIQLDGRPEDWAGIAPAIRDPREEEAGIPASLDLGDVDVAYDGRRLLLWVELWDKPDPQGEYRVEVHPLSPGEVGPPEIFVFRPGAPGEYARGVFGPHSLEVAIPSPHAIGPSGTMVSVEACRGGATIDRTAWALLRRSGSAR